MATVTGLGHSWNLPNFAGELFTASPVETPLLNLIGGMSGGLVTQNPEFPTAQLYEFPDAEQPSISEQASATAPVESQLVRTQEKNVTQIHQRSLKISYHSLASPGRMSGLNTAGQTPNPQEELAWQITNAGITATARDIEYSFIMGQYNLATNENEVNQTRGMLQLCQEKGTYINAAGAPLDFALLQSLYREMADAGASFSNMVLFVPAASKQRISSIYGELPGAALPATRTEGGINVSHIMTDFTEIRVIWNRFMPADTLLLADISVLAPVFQEVPGKGVFFVEELARTGAAERRQLYGEIGLDHGPGFMHGAITGLEV